MLLPGCVLFPNQRALTDYARQVALASSRQAMLEQALADSEERIGQLEEVVRAQGAEQSTRLETMEQVEQEINRLRGEMEVSSFQLQEATQQLEDDAITRELRFLHLEQRMGQVEEFLGVEAPPPPSRADLGLEPAEGDTGAGAVSDGDPPAEGDEATGEAGSELPEPEQPATAQDRLEKAIAHMQAGRQKVARAVLEKALEEFPDASEAAEMRYRIGETWQNDKAWPQAVQAYQEVINRYGSTDWGAWSMLRQGECFDGMGRKNDATLFFEEVQRAYPRTDAAKEAKRLLGAR